jgi:hypothetical protein
MHEVFVAIVAVASNVNSVPNVFLTVARSAGGRTVLAFQTHKRTREGSVNHL